MTMFVLTLALFLGVDKSFGFEIGRRNFVYGVPLATVVASNQPVFAAEIAACKKGANNCWSTASVDKNKIDAWTWPAGTSRTDAIKSLKKTVEAYPQEGQSGVDLGGWSYADGALDEGYARLEFKSGIGNFAKFFNNGKPFIDDLELAVGPDSVSIKSASRVGDSDFNVNAKRLNYIAASLREQGWSAPEIPIK
uniref:DUF1499 domain-containing protein n=1 Tax=Aureoumbra lagunensis TaxID=44058 RepID=A0A7S3NPV2_9STRA